jgi:HEAT repeat protein
MTDYSNKACKAEIFRLTSIVSSLPRLETRLKIRNAGTALVPAIEYLVLVVRSYRPSPVFTFSNKQVLRAAVIFVGALSLVSALVWAFAQREPSFRGQSITELLDEYWKELETTRSGGEKSTYSATAIRQIGATAVPHLLDTLFYDESFFSDVRRWLNGKQSLIWFDAPDKRRSRRVAAAFAFVALEEEGKAAFPILTNKFLNDPSPTSAIALAGTQEGVRYLLQMLRNTNDYTRYFAVDGLGYAAVDTSEVALALVKTVDDPFSLIPSSAVSSLGKLHPESPDALLATLHTLTKSLSHSNWLVRRNSAGALGRYGVTAKHLIPQLTFATTDNVAQVRYAAATAIEEIAPGKPFVEQLFLEALRDSDAHVRYRFILDLASRRSTNKVLLEEIKKMAVTDPESYVRATAQWALDRLKSADETSKDSTIRN